MTVEYMHLDGREPTRERFRQTLIDSPPPVITLDVETISLKERLPLGFGVGVSPDEAWYFYTYPEHCAEVELVLPLLRNPEVKKVMHNSPFDLRTFPLIADIDSTNIGDTNIMARLCGETDTVLANLIHLHGRSTTPARVMLLGGKTMLDIPPVEVAKHCMQDCMATYSLYHRLAPKVISLGLSRYLSVEMQVIPILVKMSLRGIKVNQTERAELEDALTREVEFYRDYCENQMPSHLRFNPASNQQVAYVLTTRHNFLPFTKGSRGKSKKNLSVSEEVLESLSDPLADLVLNFRKANKLLTTYIRPLKGEDRAYCEYNFDSAVGRINSSNMNMQNIPGKDSVKKSGSMNVRNMFMPDNYCFSTGDFSQEHLRILCYMSGDKQMESVYIHGEYDGDIHLKTAAEAGVHRQVAKTLNYAIPYGATAETIDQQGKFHNRRKAQRLLDSWFRAYPQAHEWLMEAQSYGMRHGKTLPTLFGRSIVLPYEGEGRGAYEASARKCVNYPILGSDGEIMKRAIIVADAVGLPLALTVHDSITADSDVEFPVDTLENITPFRLPFEVKKTLRWE